MEVTNVTLVSELWPREHANPLHKWLDGAREALLNE